MAILVSDVRSSFERYKKDISDVSTTLFAEWCDWTNKFAYRHLRNIDPARFISTTTYTVTASGGQNLPSDFDNMNDYGCGIFYKDDNGDDTMRQLNPTRFGDQTPGFYLTSGQIFFTGFDNSSATFTLRYIPKITQIDELTDYFTVDTTVSGTQIIPDDFLQYLVYQIDTLYTQWDEDIAAESFADARFVRALDELSRKYSRTADAFALTDYTQYY